MAATEVHPSDASGKTESMKICMNYLVWRAEVASGQRKSTGPEPTTDNADLTMRIMQSNPVRSRALDHSPVG